MTTETKSKFKKQRLFKVSRELNVSIDTIREHLEEAGFDAALKGKGLNAAIVDEDAYLSLLDAYAEDKAVAARVSRKRAARQADEDDESAVIAAPVVEKAPPVPEPVEVEAPPPPAEPVAVEPITEPEPEVAVAIDEPDVVEVDAETEEVEAAPAEPTVADAEIEEAVVEPEPVTAEAEAETAVPVPPAPVAEEPAVSAADDERVASSDQLGRTMDTITADRYQLSGTKVVGTIDLADVDESEKPKRRKRKRKPLDGSDDTRVASGTAADSRGKKKRKTKKRGPSVDQAEVVQTVQETLRELEQGASRVRQRRRRERRAQHAADREREMEQRELASEVLRVTEYVSTGELANLLDIPVTDIISVLMSGGMMVSINQRLDADTIQYVASEIGVEVEFIQDVASDDIYIADDAEEDLRPRAAVVTVMGHVDHGKTSLLDYIRRANVVAGEAGGITQHIGAYRVNLESGKEITFLDTPGHEAFTAMRARGAKVTDIVILVVAADDSVMPQTIEAINHARAAEVPIIVAVNKIDKPDSNPQRVMQELAEQGVLIEGYGGKVQNSLVSAKTGEGIDDLLEKVLLEAEILDLKANPDRNAIGTIIESRLDKGRGVVATILVQNGSLAIGDKFVAGVHSGSVRAMFDERDKRVEEIGPSQPALVLGFDGAPEVGDQFIGMDDEREAREIAQHRQQIHREQALRQRKHITLDEIKRRMALGDFRELNLIVKADVGGSVEALSDALLKLGTEEVVVNIIHTGVGAITESDVLLASASDAVIIGFQVRPAPAARAAAEKEEIDVRTYSIIYKAISDVRDALEGLLSPERSEKTLGTVEVRETFKVPKVGTIAGSYVVDGRIRRNDQVHLIRDGVVIYDGRVGSLRRFKDDATEVKAGFECGVGIEGYDDLKVGDLIESFEIVETARKLED